MDETRSEAGGVTAVDPQVYAVRQQLLDAHRAGRWATFQTLIRLSGPGWLQGALALGVGTLGSSLYLGVLGGFTLLWIPLVGMGLGVIMLGAVSYVTLSTGERPLQLIRHHINAPLAYFWALGALLTSMIWSMPQYAMATAALQQNLLPGILGRSSSLGEVGGRIVICTVLLFITILISWSYGTGARGIKVYDVILKGMVALIVACFFGVVVRLAFTPDGLDWAAILPNYIPNPRTLWKPAPSYDPFLGAIGAGHRDLWRSMILSDQRDQIITAIGSTVGINMTFLLPHLLLSRGWDRTFRGLSIFDLVTGLLVPYVIVTSCVMIAGATQFHAQYRPSLIYPAEGAGAVAPADKELRAKYDDVVARYLRLRIGSERYESMTSVQHLQASESLPRAEKTMAAMLVRRDAFNLAESLGPLLGTRLSRIIFGVGVLGIVLSTITLAMLTCGFVITEIFGYPQTGWPLRIACLAAVVGPLGPFLWAGQTQFWLSVPTTFFGVTLLPVAYITFALLMNRPSALGESVPRGPSRVLWNTFMAAASLFALAAAAWSVYKPLSWPGLIAAAGLLATLLFWPRRTPDPGIHQRQSALGC